MTNPFMPSIELQGVACAHRSRWAGTGRTCLRPQGHDNTLLSADLGVWSRKAEATGLVS
jgi:hypothetical protein